MIRFHRFLIIPALAAALAVALATMVAQAGAESGDQADFSVITAGGNRLTVTSALSPLEINRMHSWRLRLTNAENAPVVNAEITLSGGMPDHDHGLPTQPIVTGEPEPGIYLLEGIRFHMPGRWLLQFTMALGDTSDSASLEFSL